MNLLFITDARPHAHDYGVDFLIQGAYALLGKDHVFEWPEKPNLHLALGADRDACQIDSDAWLPAKRLPADYLRTMANRGEFDAVILTGAYGTAEPWRHVCGALPSATPVIGLHYDDEVTDTRAVLEALMGRSLTAYYHREQPPAHARPLWLTQPCERVRPVQYKYATLGVFYHGSTHGWDADSPRRRMLNSVCEATVENERQVFLTEDQERGRMRPEVYREHLWHAAISVLWNSNRERDFPVWQSNRFMESLALGCAVVAERPWGETGTHFANHFPAQSIAWIDAPEDAASVVRTLLDDHERTRAMAELAQRAFVESFTSERMLDRPSCCLDPLPLCPGRVLDRLEWKRKWLGLMLPVS